MPERRAFVKPPDDVLRAFGASEPLEHLKGGQGQVFRSDDLILKPAKDDEQTNWIAGFYASAQCEGFRLPQPICSGDGRYVVDGWQAWEFVDGEHRSDNWEETVRLCLRFHEAIADIPRSKWFDRMPLDNPWSIADKVAWNELEIEHHPTITPVTERLRRCFRENDSPSQLIHGDFGGNVLFSDELPPAIIDLSPYWRPAGFAVGVVVADAIVWEGADFSLIEAVAKLIDNFNQHLARAELRRIIELDVAHRLWGWDVLGELDDHLPLITRIGELCG
ncbi:hypothetical protein ACFLSZ_02250 [Candidatus Bipolaricaulota bacterium]